MSFPIVNPKQSFPALERETLAYWKANNTFKKSLAIREGAPEFNFYDGPPFATGTPHYGHLLAGTIKDVIPRYQTMQGKYVERRFGWDCHGLPIENIVEKKMNISGKKDIEEKIGVYEFNEGCRANVFGYTDVWRQTVERMGRWVDMDHDYKTMDTEFMESVWWVFSEIYKKGLIYESYRVVPYCPRCSTPLSNFEVNQGYEDKQDKAVTVKFIPKIRNATAIYIENEKGEVLLGHHKKNEHWCFPGGKGEEGETFEETAMRELLEETGLSLKINPEDCKFEQYDVIGGQIFNNHIFKLKIQDVSIKNGEPHKFHEWKFFPKDALPENFSELTRHALEQIDQGLGRENPPISILAWTTTPWTLPANLGLAVGSDIIYVEIFDKSSNECYILAKDRIGSYYKNPEDYEMVREFPGSNLVGVEYEPMFDDFVKQSAENSLPKDVELGKNAYHIVPGHHVTTESGTGVVHIAPAYGEDDFQIGKRENLGFISHIDAIGHTTGLLCDNDVYVFDYNQIVIDRLKAEKKIIHIGTIDHSYPHCYRCHTPLIYRAISAWYVNVESIKDKMIANNEKITWVPDTIKHGRFGKWVEGARDWNISRNRYWGSALPVWKSEDGDVKVIGSVEELYQANREFGQMYKEDGKYFYTDTKQPVDLHKHFVDKIFLQNPEARKAKKVLIVHGRGSDINSEKWKERICLFRENGLDVDLFQFDRSDDPTYESWKETFETIDFFQYDTIYTGSLGGVMTVKYLSENKIKVPRLVMAVPGISLNTEQGKKPNVMNIWKSLSDDSFKNLADEIIVIHTKDNETVPFRNGKTFAEKLGAFFVEFNQGGHKLYGYQQLIIGLVKYGTPMRRIPEVLDCWFESGSMPYASKHYPFEGKNDFKFPADFIAEGLDQTRGWFYTLLILGTALFDNTPFLNVIVNGMILAEDGKKMSKSLSNYPDPIELIERHSADALRFYMLSSPVVKADDLRFSEAGVEEVVKKVLLPLWNTYSFFTTYANIDNFVPNTTEIYFMRHGQTDANLEGRLSDGLDNSPLNATGKKQAEEAGKQILANHAGTFDVIIASPLVRTRETAEIIAKTIGHKGEIIFDESFIERLGGKFSGMRFEDIEREMGIKIDYTKSGHMQVMHEGESLEDIYARVADGYQKLLQKYQGKRILIVSHGGVYRPLLRFAKGLSLEEAYAFKGIGNCEVVKLFAHPITNKLDIWIISRLNRLIAMVEGGFEAYDLQIPTRAILEFMDELTNWYIRRSRRRFWKSENDGDKLGAYETLYHVLVTLTKVMAPITPMISEAVYRGLTLGESIHLERFPEYSRTSIFPGLDADMNRVREIITLGLALRGQKKIRVRQPLASITIGEPLSEYFQEIICEELNVKEVKIEDMSHVARKICRPNAKLIGAKFGKAVQDIIREAKAGNFQEIENGRIKILYLNRDCFNAKKREFENIPEVGKDEVEYILEESEYEIAYEPIEGVTLDVMSGSGMVVAMDTKITKELELEGYARDIVRVIQDLRKEAGYEVSDRIRVRLSGDGVDAILALFAEYITSETLSVLDSSLTSGDISKEIEMERMKINVVVKK